MKNSWLKNQLRFSCTVRLTPEYRAGIIGGVGLGLLMGVSIDRDMRGLVMPISFLLIAIGSSIAFRAQQAQRERDEKGISGIAKPIAEPPPPATPLRAWLLVLALLFVALATILGVLFKVGMDGIGC